MIAWILITVVLLSLAILARASVILPGRRQISQIKRRSTDNCSLAVFLGSGGHTTEAIALIGTLDFTRYTPRTYIVSEGDAFSAQKAADLERMKATKSSPSDSAKYYRVLTIPRARRVHQSFYTAPASVLVSLASCLYHLTYLPFRTSRAFAEVLILNGPGTCFTLCMATYVSRFFNVASPRLIYVESFARVKTLSLSGKLLRPLVDRFVVQWPEALNDGGRGECRGWLV